MIDARVGPVHLPARRDAELVGHGRRTQRLVESLVAVVVELEAAEQDIAANLLQPERTRRGRGCLAENNGLRDDVVSG